MSGAEHVVVGLSGVAKEFGDRRVIDIDELCFRRGRAYALVGHNGAGKTMLLRLIAGLEAPSRGAIRREIDRKQIAFCAQRPYLFRGSVRRNIAWGLAARRLDTHAAAVLTIEAARRLGMERLLDHDARRLSAGEAQKTSLARSLVLRPILLLADEPAANLDRQSLDLLESELCRYMQEGGTCIVATHLAEHAPRVCTDIVRLEQGRVLASLR